MTDPTGLYSNDGHLWATHSIFNDIVNSLRTKKTDNSEPLVTKLAPGHYDIASYQRIAASTRAVDYAAETTPFYGVLPWATYSNLKRKRIIEDFGEPAIDAYATEFYHFESLVVNENRMRWALDQPVKDFGRALHGFQDYFSHVGSGFTFANGVAGLQELYTKCPQCLERDHDQTFEMKKRAIENFAHIPHSLGEWQEEYTDRYNEDNPRDRRMAAATEYWITLYLLRDSEVNENDYYETYEKMSPEAWYQQNSYE